MRLNIDEPIMMATYKQTQHNTWSRPHCVSQFNLQEAPFGEDNSTYQTLLPMSQETTSALHMIPTPGYVRISKQHYRG